MGNGRRKRKTQTASGRPSFRQVVSMLDVRGASKRRKTAFLCVVAAVLVIAVVITGVIVRKTNETKRLQAIEAQPWVLHSEFSNSGKWTIGDLILRDSSKYGGREGLPTMDASLSELNRVVNASRDANSARGYYFGQHTLANGYSDLKTKPTTTDGIETTKGLGVGDSLADYVKAYEGYPFQDFSLSPLSSLDQDERSNLYDELDEKHPECSLSYTSTNMDISDFLKKCDLSKLDGKYAFDVSFDAVIPLDAEPSIDWSTNRTMAGIDDRLNYRTCYTSCSLDRGSDGRETRLGRLSMDIEFVPYGGEMTASAIDVSIDRVNHENY